MQLLVLGMHRSGTSVLARMLNLMGIYFGPEGISTGANKENPKGFWERRDVRILNDSVLHAVGCDWNRVARFDVASLPPHVTAKFVERASRLVLEMDAHRPWFIKEPRLCLLLPLWRKVLEVPVCVHILRHPLEVAASLQTRNDMPIPVGLELWERYVRAAIAGSADLPFLMVSHRQLMQRPLDAVASLRAQLANAGVGDLRVPSKPEVLAHVRDDLYREREENAPHSYSDSRAVRLFNRLEAGQAIDCTEIHADGQSVLTAYESSLSPLNAVSSALGDSIAQGAIAIQLALKEQEVSLLREMSSKIEGSYEQRVTRLDNDFRQALEKASRLELSLADMQQAASNAARQLADRDASIAGLERETHAVRGALRTAEEEGRRVQADSHELKAHLEKTEAHVQELEALLDQSRSDIRKLEAGIQEKDQTIAELRARERAAELATEEQTRTRFSEIAQLTGLLFASRHELDAEKACRREDAKTHAAKLASLVARHQARADVLLERVQRYRDAVSMMERSRTWRLASRLRQVLGGGRPSTAHDRGPTKPERKLLGSSPLFDAKWYLAAYPDVAASGADPMTHFFEFGAAEGRNPSSGFNTAKYMKQHPGMPPGENPLVHYLINEWKGG